jgi:hypothetical protein
MPLSGPFGAANLINQVNQGSRQYNRIPYKTDIQIVR